MSDWLTAGASGVTLIIVAVTAFAALRQMAYMRSGNQVTLFTSYNTEWDSPEFAQAFEFVRSFSVETLDDATLASLAGGTFPAEFHSIRRIANFFEDMGAFVHADILPKKIVCMLYGENIAAVWEKISPIVMFLRSVRNEPAIWEHLEYLAIISEEYVAAHRNDVFPRGMQRKPSDELLMNRYRALSRAGAARK